MAWTHMVESMILLADFTRRKFTQGSMLRRCVSVQCARAFKFEPRFLSGKTRQFEHDSVLTNFFVYGSLMWDGSPQYVIDRLPAILRGHRRALLSLIHI